MYIETSYVRVPLFMKCKLLRLCDVTWNRAALCLPAGTEEHRQRRIRRRRIVGVRLLPYHPEGERPQARGMHLLNGYGPQRLLHRPSTIMASP